MDVIGTAEHCCTCIPGRSSNKQLKPPATIKKPPRTFLVRVHWKGAAPSPN